MSEGGKDGRGHPQVNWKATEVPGGSSPVHFWDTLQLEEAAHLLPRPWAAGEPVLSQQEAVGRGLLSPLAGFPQRRQPATSRAGVQVELRLCVSGAWVRVELHLCGWGSGGTASLPPGVLSLLVVRGSLL